jgi:hypothetical protein
MRERKIKLQGNLWKSYKRYKSLWNNNVSRTTYCSICIDFNRIVSDKIIKESFEFKLPFGLGILRIKANKIKYKFKDGKLDYSKMATNWNETLKLWNKIYPNKTKEELKQIPNKKLVVHTNEHTDGSIMRWYWDKYFAKVNNITVYKFKPVKGGIFSDNLYTGRLGLSAWIKDENRTNEYYN